MLQDVRSPHLVVKEVEPVVRLTLGLDVQLPLERPDPLWSCQEANLLSSAPSEAPRTRASSLHRRYPACSTRVAARRFAGLPYEGWCPGGLTTPVAQGRPPVATRLYRQLPRQDLHPQERATFHGAPQRSARDRDGEAASESTRLLGVGPDNPPTTVGLSHEDCHSLYDTRGHLGAGETPLPRRASGQRFDTCQSRHMSYRPRKNPAAAVLRKG